MCRRTECPVYGLRHVSAMVHYATEWKDETNLSNSIRSDLRSLPGLGKLFDINLLEHCIVLISTPLSSQRDFEEERESRNGSLLTKRVLFGIDFGEGRSSP